MITPLAISPKLNPKALATHLTEDRWVYAQRTGNLYYVGHKVVELVATGYSGAPACINDPASQDVVACGPIPRGRYRLGAPYKHPRLGPVTIGCYPETPHESRNGFFIHGDNSLGNRSASSGCIIVGRAVRDRIGKGSDALIVIEDDLIR